MQSLGLGHWQSLRGPLAPVEFPSKPRPAAAGHGNHAMTLPRGKGKGLSAATAVLLFLGSGFAPPARPVTPPIFAGRISGVVLDAQSKPLARARVFAWPVGAMMGAAIPMAFTDTAGRFLFPRLAWGRYRVGAEKLSENYPDVANPIYRSDGIAPLVVLPRGDQPQKSRFVLA